MRPRGLPVCGVPGDAGWVRWEGDWRMRRVCVLLREWPAEESRGFKDGVTECSCRIINDSVTTKGSLLHCSHRVTEWCFAPTTGEYCCLTCKYKGPCAVRTTHT
jgi:hypothetical protein